MKALALVDAPEHVCCRYRIRAFEPALSDAGWSLTVEGTASSLLGRLLQFGRSASFEAVILQRKLLPRWQFRELRRRARHLVFDFDDAVLYRDSYDVRGPFCRRRSARFAYTVRRSDTVIAGNDFLADCALRAGARPDQVRVIPTCLATDGYPADTHRSSGEHVQLVWIGSSSTLRGLEQQRSLWEHLGRELPGLQLRVIADRFPHFDALPVIPIRWSQTTEAVEVAAGDVGISWIPEDLWSRGKCGLKVLQYQAAGLPVVANPVGVHSEMVEPGRSGYLASSPEEWTEAIRALAGDPGLRRRMGREGKAAVEAGYSVRAWASTFVATIAGTGPVPTPKFESKRSTHFRQGGRPSPGGGSEAGRRPILRSPRPRNAT
jgi:glycosyltransferase involved in cell wall biosynthesis